jgi:hypothetical protein
MLRGVQWYFTQGHTASRQDAKTADPQDPHSVNAGFLAFGSSFWKSVREADNTEWHSYILGHFLCLYSLRMVFMHFIPSQFLLIFFLNRKEKWFKKELETSGRTPFILWFCVSPNHNKRASYTPLSSCFSLPCTGLVSAHLPHEDQLPYCLTGSYSAMTVLRQHAAARCQ